MGDPSSLKIQPQTMDWIMSRNVEISDDMSFTHEASFMIVICQERNSDYRLATKTADSQILCNPVSSLVDP
ncbi:MAG: hypothetical protein ACLQPD_08195 [Desulfomonilaceae bacterium]